MLDIELRDGNKKKFEVSGGISPITGKITVEGPIKKDTTSFILSGRSTYSDWILGKLDDPDLRNSSASFNYIITKLSHNLNHNNSITLSAYHSKDKFRLASDTLYKYHNSNVAIEWRHTINDRLFSSYSASFSDYSYNITSEESVTNAFELKYNIRNTTAKGSFNWLPNASHDVKFGLDATLYDLESGSIRPIGAESVIAGVKLDNERGLESALYIGDEWELSPKLSFYAGLRYSVFNLMGPGDVFTYPEGTTKEIDLITDTLQFKKGDII